MGKRAFALLVVTIVGLGIAGAPHPAAAQEQVTIPAEYPEDLYDLQLAPRDTPPERMAAEAAAADAAQAACERGELAGCTALGRAFLHGEGRPQNRRAAEMVLREACEGSDGPGCRMLGDLLQTVALPSYRREGRLILARGCQLGDLDACASEAGAVEQGDDKGRDGDRQAATALRRAACAKGSTKSCHQIGRDLLFSRVPEERVEGRIMLVGLCRGGWGDSCERLQGEVAGDAPLAREIAAHGCDAGLADQCRLSGVLLFARPGDAADARTAALVALDRACALGSQFCTIAEQVRAEPALVAGCGRGAAADCLALGRIYATYISPLFRPLEAARLLGEACETGESAVCREAAEALDAAGPSPMPERDAAMARWLDLGCRGGVNADCDKLGTGVLEGEILPDQRDLGFASLARGCERGDFDLCDKFDNYAEDDPSAPIIPVDGRFSATLEEEGEDEAGARTAGPRSMMLDAISLQNAEEERCRTTSATWRGTVYVDKLCRPAIGGVIRGRFARVNEAPWIALLWRPKQLAGQTLGPERRLECGGAYIRDGWVLTAAHCVVDEKGNLFVTKGYRVRLGAFRSFEPDGIEYQIKRIYRHPDYKQGLRTFDIALIELDLTRRVRVGAPRPLRTIPYDEIPVANRSFPAGSPVRVYGWGNTSFEGRASDQLKVADLKLEGQTDCEKATGMRRGYLKAMFLCAKASDRAQACDGDSGGPLVLDQTNALGVKSPLLVGLVGTGTACGQSGVATRYTRVSKMSEWIRNVFAGREEFFVPR